MRRLGKRIYLIHTQSGNFNIWKALRGTKKIGSINHFRFRLRSKGEVS